jgi:hypothetical protein
MGHFYGKNQIRFVLCLSFQKGTLLKFHSFYAKVAPINRMEKRSLVLRLPINSCVLFAVEFISPNDCFAGIVHVLSFDDKHVWGWGSHI